MKNIQFVASKESITLFMNGQRYSATSDNENFSAILKMLKEKRNKMTDQDEKTLIAWLSVKEAIKQFFDSSGEKLIIEDGLIFYKDMVIHSSIADRIVEASKKGANAQSFVLFIENIAKNPSEQSRNELYLFLEQNKLPITEDGCFLAYKKVRNDFKDIHSGTIDYSIGKKPYMKRKDVDSDRSNTCSSGLHFCSKDYLYEFSSYDSKTDRVIIVKINPKDVVSIPYDYNNAKGRTWKMEVISELKDWKKNKIVDSIITTKNLTQKELEDRDDYEDPDEVFEDWDHDDDDYDWLDDEEDTFCDDEDDDFEDSVEEGYEEANRQNILKNFDKVEWAHMGIVYHGYALRLIPALEDAKEIIHDQVPEKLLEYAKDKVKHRLANRDRYVVYCTHKNGYELDTPELLAPSVRRTVNV